MALQSPQDCWPIHIFYGGDTRLNLELNIGNNGKTGYLNNFIEGMYDNGKTVYVASDAMFADAILGGKLDPKSDNDFNLYNYETIFTESKVGATTGLRSELKRVIEREHPESLIPAVPTCNFIPCANHMFTRITEHLVKRRVLACMELEALAKKGTGAMEKESALKHFLANINARCVRDGNFSVAFENKKLQPITLNVKCAELISAPPSAFSSTYSNILENVASHSTFPTPLPVALQKALGRSSPVISEFELESEIWRVHWELHLLCRKDPDPRKECLEENRFGLAEKEIGDYLTLADTFHALMLHRYGATGLYPYVVKRVDIVPILLKELPFHSLFRGSTEGGEHSHYLHQCLFYGHSARGGGHIKEDPILTIFKWYYRQILQRVCATSLENQKKFEDYVASIFAEKGVLPHACVSEHPQAKVDEQLLFPAQQTLVQETFAQLMLSYISALRVCFDHICDVKGGVSEIQIFWVELAKFNDKIEYVLVGQSF